MKTQKRHRLKDSRDKNKKHYVEIKKELNQIREKMIDREQTNESRHSPNFTPLENKLKIITQNKYLKMES